MTSKTFDYGSYPRYLKDMGKTNADNVLKAVGLQTRRPMSRTVFSGAGLVGVGVAVGLGLGMLFAPRRGEQLRREMREKAETMKERMGAYKAKVEQKAEEHPAPPNA